jgi:molecular chaperone DnaK
MANLNAIWQTASEEMYKNSAQAPPQGGPEGGQQQNQQQGSKGSGNDEVTDVDFEEVKDK